jgi:anaerobic magnesium-protoporphyrin IX monomethyl ester cyclase
MNIKKVLLFVPPAITFRERRDINPLPPMGLGYLAAMLKSKDFDVTIFDSMVLGWEKEEKIDEQLVRVGLSNEEIKQYLNKEQPDVVGITCQFSRQQPVYDDMLTLIKTTLPSAIVAAGGAHATVCPEKLLENKSCDYVIRGEGEESFLDFLNKLTRNEGLESVDGLCWRNNDGVVINEKLGWITDLDSIPFPAYDAMNLEQYFGLEASHGLRHKNKYSPIITSRGCPAKCTFCSAHKVWGRKYRLRSIENVLAEMEFLKSKYGIEELMFEDDNVTANNKRAKGLFQGMIDRKFSFVWDTPNGVGAWSLDEELLDLMKASGCLKVNYPVESGSQRVLKKIIKKPLDLDKTRRLILYSKRIGLDCGMFLVIGMPGETVQDIKQSFKYAADCHCFTPHISVATPYPGTELYEWCQKNKYFAYEYRFEDLFIRSFMIQTPEWNDKKLKKLLWQGMVYLKFKQACHNPSATFRWLVNRVKRSLTLMRSS